MNLTSNKNNRKEREISILGFCHCGWLCFCVRSGAFLDVINHITHLELERIGEWQKMQGRHVK